MPLTSSPQPKIPVDFVQPSFGGGINTSLPPELIAEDEAQEILNFEFNDDDHLRTRAGVFDWASGFTFPRRITSIHHYQNDLGASDVLVTSANKLYKTGTGTVSFSDITGTLSLPNDVFWQWKTYGGLAIGVNGTAPVKYDGTAAHLGGSPPNASFVEVWNDRVWLVSSADPNVVYGSVLGDPEDWTVGNAAQAVVIDVSKNDGDRITGLYAYKGQLFVFKRRRIYVISALEGTLATDVGNLFVELYAHNVGCVSGFTIQSVFDDVLFLSEQGVVSLASAPLGELKTVIVSKKVKELRQIRKTSNQFGSLVLNEANQYWIMVPADLSPRNEDEIYVLDLRRIQEGVLRWVRFNGKVAGSCATVVTIDGQNIVLIGGTNKKIYSYKTGLTSDISLWDVGVWDISKWDNVSSNFTFFDDNEAYIKRIRSKAFDFGAQFYRKLFHRFGFRITTLSDRIDARFLYFFDNNESLSDFYDFIITKQVRNPLWDVAKWDVDKWDSSVVDTFPVIRQFNRGPVGRRGINVTFELSCEQPQGFIVRHGFLEFAIFGTNRVNEVNVL